jgi:hypothetical protein
LLFIALALAAPYLALGQIKGDKHIKRSKTRKRLFGSDCEKRCKGSTRKTRKVAQTAGDLISL